MPRTGENIYKRKDGRWEGRYIKEHTLDGKAKYGYVYARTYRMVKDKLADAILANRKDVHGNVPEQDVKMFKTIADDWFCFIQPQIKESTIAKYRNLLNSYILPELGEKAIDTLTYEYMEAYCNKLLTSGGKNGQGLSAKTVTDVLSLIRNILSFSSKCGNKPLCDVHSITVKQQRKEMRILTPVEQEKLCQYLYANLNARNIGILICLFTGLRLGEICALRWEDIMLGEQMLYVHQTMQRIQMQNESTKTRIMILTPKSQCSIRKIPLPEELVQILAAFQPVSTGFFLTGSETKYLEPRNMQYYFKRVLEECSIESTNFHTLRHTFATRCVELGFDIKSLSEILGHASVNITMNRYVHPSMELKKENMQKLSSLLAVK